MSQEKGRLFRLILNTKTSEKILPSQEIYGILIQKIMFSIVKVKEYRIKAIQSQR